MRTAVIFFLSDVGHLSPQKKGRRDDILGKTDLEIWSDPTGQGIEYISEVPRDDGPGYFQIKKNPVRMDGKIVGIVGFINDITERIRLEKRVEELSVHDSLTGLYNRNYVAPVGCRAAETVTAAHHRHHGGLQLPQAGQRYLRPHLR